MTDRINNNEKALLSYMLEEFRVALEAEIYAIKRNSTNTAVPLSNGKKIGAIAKEYQYKFTTDTSINLPESSPATLVIEGKDGYLVSIIKFEDPDLFLSCKTDLGDFIGMATLESDLSILLRKLIERIDEKSDDINHAGLRMLGKEDVKGDAEKKLMVYSDEDEIEQIKAIESSVGRNLTYIWGPPGTGKTYVISNIIAELFMCNRTVLLVSHTNTAVDGAIKKSCTKLLKEKTEGLPLLRLGMPKDNELVHKFPEVLLKNQVDIISKDIINELEETKDNAKNIIEDIMKFKEKMENYYWINEYRNRRSQIVEIINEIKDRVIAIAELEHQLIDKNNEMDILNQRLKISEEYFRLIDLFNEHGSYKKTLEQDLEHYNNELELLHHELEATENNIVYHMKYNELIAEKEKHLSITSQKALIEKNQADIDEIIKSIGNEENQVVELKLIHKKSEQSNFLSRFINKIESPENIEIEINKLHEQIIVNKEKLTAKQNLYTQYKEEFNKIIAIIEELKMIKLLSNPKELKEKAKGLKNRISILKNTILETKDNYFREEIKISYIEEQINKEKQKLDFAPNEILSSIEGKNKEIKELQNKKQKEQDDLKNGEKSIIHFFAAFGFTQGNKKIEELLQEADKKENRIERELVDFNIDDTKTNIEILEKTLDDLQEKIKELEKKLTEIESQIIKNAKIIGTTLTNAYLNDEIQSREFDTVILDEASMASIPSLWAAAYLAKNNIIIVGDFMQLPPIVMASDGLAKKWLGKDVFELSGIKRKYEENDAPDYFISLKRQYRMEKEIADIANRYYKNNHLKTFGSPKGKEEFESWYASIGEEKPITIINTNSMNAWVTSVIRGRNSSRLNWLSASLCVILAKSLIKKILLRKETSGEMGEEQGNQGAKVLIISPYRPHTKHIALLLNSENSVGDLIKAGTIHSFQGSEADIVIFDLVVDEPHWRVNMFMRGEEIREQMKRLFNVAVTRAKFKLFIVGNVDYCMKKGKGSELEALLDHIINIKKTKVMDAKKLFPNLYTDTTKKMRGGNVEIQHQRACCNHENFYRYFHKDIEDAQKRIIIFSAFIAFDRLSKTFPFLQAAKSRGVDIIVITKPLQERNKTEIGMYEKCEKAMKDNQVRIIHKKGMHEKLAFIDDDIVWAGSLNILSYRNTQEIMERRKSKDVFLDYFEQLKVNGLIDIFNNNAQSCPICKAEMIASEGKDEPFFWRCTTDKCYTRSINQKHPQNGEITCKKCDSPVKFFMVKEPRWICTKEKRHYQKVMPAHLKLPLMLDKIPKKEISKVKKALGISREKEQKRGEQLSLFDFT